MINHEKISSEVKYKELKTIFFYNYFEILKIFTERFTINGR